MSIYSYSQLVNLWKANGGPAGSARTAAIVALAESSGNSFAISPTSDYGLWQINATVWFGRVGHPVIGWGNWYDPNVNARAAVAISGGHDFGPWCTMWADPARDCATGSLSSPQPGSAAYRVEQRIGGGGGGGGGSAPGPSPASTAGVSAAWGNVANMFGADARERYKTVASVRSIARAYWSDLARKG